MGAQFGLWVSLRFPFVQPNAFGSTGAIVAQGVDYDVSDPESASIYRNGLISRVVWQFDWIRATAMLPEE